VTVASSLAAAWYALKRGRPYLDHVLSWMATPPGGSTDADTIAAWDAATNFPMRSFRANGIVVGLIAAVPAVTFMTLTLALPWTAAPVLLVATVLPIAYATSLNYFVAELLMRPVVEQIAHVCLDQHRLEAGRFLCAEDKPLINHQLRGSLGGEDPPGSQDQTTSTSSGTGCRRSGVR
jgi:hypothetical protein